jgi:hypothetical protein
VKTEVVKLQTIVKKLYHHTMEMKQMMAHLLAKIKVNRAKKDATIKEMREEM